jgi:hypothetical protein
MNWAFRHWPNEAVYGFLSDDFILLTPGMLQKLEAEAGDWNVAWPNDHVYKQSLVTLWACGGELVRTCGWFAYPELLHNCVDSVWHDIAVHGGVDRYRDDLEMIPLHHTFGTAPMDETYARVEEVNKSAGNIFHMVWERSDERKRIMQRLAEVQKEREYEHG